MFLLDNSAVIGFLNTIFYVQNPQKRTTIPLIIVPLYIYFTISTHLFQPLCLSPCGSRSSTVSKKGLARLSSLYRVKPLPLYRSIYSNNSLYIVRFILFFHSNSTILYLKGGKHHDTNHSYRTQTEPRPLSGPCPDRRYLDHQERQNGRKAHQSKHLSR